MPANAIGVSGLARRYAAALFELADQAKALDATAADLRAVKAALQESADLRRLVRSPALGRDEQGRAMAVVLDKIGVSDLTRRFVAVVAGHRRLFALGGMIDAFLEDLAARRGELTADVTAATDLSAEQTASLTDQIRKAVGAKVSVRVTVDPELIGGIVVKVGSRMVDASLRTKLNKLQLAMKGIA